MLMKNMLPGMKIPRPTLLVLALLSLAGLLAIIYSTRWGPWAYSDSTKYIVSARTFLEGGGLGTYTPSGDFERLTHHPPLYALVLSAFGLLGADLLAAARWLNVFLFGATIFATGAFTYHLLRSSWLAISLSVVVFVMPTLVDIFSGAMSEPLFIFTSVLGVFLITLFLETDRRHHLILAASAAGLAFLTRYIGVFVIVTGIAALLILSRSAWKARLANLAIYGLISVFPNAIWWLYVYLHTTSYAARQLVSSADIWSSSIQLRLLLAENFWSWLPFPEYLPPYTYNLARYGLIAIGTMLAGGFALTLAKSREAEQLKWPISQEFSFIFMWVTAALAYLASLAYSYVFTEPTPDVTPRTLLPVQLFLAFFGLGSGLFFMRELHLPRWCALVPVLLALPFIIYYAQTSWELIRSYHEQGTGYTGVRWREEDILEAVARLPADLPIITNETAALLLWTNRPAYEFCTLPCDQPGNTRYGDNPADEVQHIFREHGAALVLFYPFCAPRDNAWIVERMAELESLTRGLNSLEYSCGGAIYFYPK